MLTNWMTQIGPRAALRARRRKRGKTAPLPDPVALRRAEDIRRLAGAPSTLTAAGLFAASGIAGGFLVFSQLPDATPTPAAHPVLSQVNPAAQALPVDIAALPQPPEGVQVQGAEPTPTVDEVAAAAPEPAPVTQPDEQVFSSLSLDAESGRTAQTVELTREQSEICRANLTAAADRLTVRFSANSTSALPEDMDAAFSFAEGVAVCSGIRVQVQGHADATGDETQNLLLSWERAESVIAELEAAGHDVSAYEPVGYGSRQLLADTSEDPAVALNRRVEFAVIPLRP